MLGSRHFKLACSLCFARRSSTGALLSFEIADHFLSQVSVHLHPLLSLCQVLHGLPSWFPSWFWNTIPNFRFHFEYNLKFVWNLGSFSFRTAARSYGIVHFHQEVFLHELAAFCALGLWMISSFTFDWINPTRKLVAQQRRKYCLNFDQVLKVASSFKFSLFMFKNSTANSCHFYLVLHWSFASGFAV